MNPPETPVPDDELVPAVPDPPIPPGFPGVPLNPKYGAVGGATYPGFPLDPAPPDDPLLPLAPVLPIGRFPAIDPLLPPVVPNNTVPAGPYEVVLKLLPVALLIDFK